MKVRLKSLRGPGIRLRSLCCVWLLVAYGCSFTDLVPRRLTVGAGKYSGVQEFGDWDPGWHDVDHRGHHTSVYLSWDLFASWFEDRQLEKWHEMQIASMPPPASSIDYEALASAVASATARVPEESRSEPTASELILAQLLANQSKSDAPLPPPIEVVVEPTPIEVVVEPTPIEIRVDPTPVEVQVAPTPPPAVNVTVPVPEVNVTTLSSEGARESAPTVNVEVHSDTEYGPHLPTAPDPEEAGGEEAPASVTILGLSPSLWQQLAVAAAALVAAIAGWLNRHRVPVVKKYTKKGKEAASAPQRDETQEN